MIEASGLEKSQASAARRSSSAPPSSFTPAFAEVKGFVDNFEEVANHGVTKVDAENLFANLKTATSPDFRDGIGALELKGERSFSMKIWINGNFDDAGVPELLARLRALEMTRRPIP